MSTPTPTPRPALKATGMRRRHARCPEAELATLTTERDHWQKIAVSASHEREHNANVAQAMTTERNQLRAERDSIKQEIEMVEHRAYRAEVERDQLRAEVERLRSDRDCEKRLRKDADEFRENAIERAMKAEAELAAERARLDWVFRNCKVFAADYTIHDREDLGAAMKEGAK